MSSLRGYSDEQAVVFNSLKFKPSKAAAGAQSGVLRATITLSQLPAFIQWKSVQDGTHFVPHSSIKVKQADLEAGHGHLLSLAKAAWQEYIARGKQGKRLEVDARCMGQTLHCSWGPQWHAQGPTSSHANQPAPPEAPATAAQGKPVQTRATADAISTVNCPYRWQWYLLMSDVCNLATQLQCKDPAVHIVLLSEQHQGHGPRCSEAAGTTKAIAPHRSSASRAFSAVHQALNPSASAKDTVHAVRHLVMSEAQYSTVDELALSTLAAYASDGCFRSKLGRDAYVTTQDVVNDRAAVVKPQWELDAHEPFSIQQLAYNHKEMLLLTQQDQAWDPNTNEETTAFCYSFSSTSAVSLAVLLGHKQPLFIDATYGMNKYGFPLFTLMALDSQGHGFPVAFCISSRTREDVVTLFLKAFSAEAHKILPTFSPSCVITDNDRAQINAIRTVWPAAQPHLCTWHVKHGWLTNLFAKAPRDGQVYADLWQAMSQLMHSHPGAGEDVQQWAQSQVLSIKGRFKGKAPAFIQYAQEHYFASGKIELWLPALHTAANRGHTGTQVLESYHRWLKSEPWYQRRQAHAMRLDWLVYHLASVVLPDSLFKVLARLTGAMPISPATRRDDQDTLDRAMAVADSCIEMADGRWSVPSRHGRTPHVISSWGAEGCCCSCSRYHSHRSCHHLLAVAVHQAGLSRKQAQDVMKSLDAITPAGGVTWQPDTATAVSSFCQDRLASRVSGLQLPATAPAPHHAAVPPQPLRATFSPSISPGTQSQAAQLLHLLSRAKQVLPCGGNALVANVSRAVQLLEMSVQPPPPATAEQAVQSQPLGKTGTGPISKVRLKSSLEAGVRKSQPLKSIYQHSKPPASLTQQVHSKAAALERELQPPAVVPPAIPLPAALFKQPAGGHVLQPHAAHNMAVVPPAIPLPAALFKQPAGGHVLQPHAAHNMAVVPPAIPLPAALPAGRAHRAVLQPRGPGDHMVPATATQVPHLRAADCAGDASFQYSQGSKLAGKENVRPAGDVQPSAKRQRKPKVLLSL